MNATARRGGLEMLHGNGEALVSLQTPNPTARMRVFCFPYAGGSASASNTWMAELPEDVRVRAEFCAIQLPGRETNIGQPPFESLSALLAALVPVIVRRTSKPFVFVGHSMGALVLFELVRELRRQGVRAPVHMIVSGFRAPQLPARHPPIHRLPDAQLVSELRKFGGTPEEVLQEPELMNLLLPVLRADFAVCERFEYTSEAPLQCSITALGGRDDERVGPVELAAWRCQTGGAFSMHFFPGGHFFIHSARALVLRAVAQDLRLLLRRLGPGSRGALGN